LAGAELTPAAEVSLKLSALGQRFDEKVAYRPRPGRSVPRRPRRHDGDALDMEDHATTDSTLEILSRLRVRLPVHRAPCCRPTCAGPRATAGSWPHRVAGPVCKGRLQGAERRDFQNRLDVDKSYVRCLNILMSGRGLPDAGHPRPALVAIGEDRAKWFDRSPDTFEFQMLYGSARNEQARLVDAGYTMRVYVPYGTQWYGYLMRRLAERPANVAFFARTLAREADPSCRGLRRVEFRA
jgi:proline dehydrogenase